MEAPRTDRDRRAATAEATAPPTRLPGESGADLPAPDASRRSTWPSPPRPLPILMLQGDLEASLLAGAEAFLQGLLPHRTVEWTAAWAPRADLLAPGAPPPPEPLRRRGLIPDADARELLERPNRLVLVSMFSALANPMLRHRSGGAFVAHRGLRARWSAEAAAAIAAECVEEPPLSPEDAAGALEPLVEGLQERGAAVALCTAFRHVREPLQHRRPDGAPPLRELARRVNLEAARLSRRTGCFVLDLDRPLSQEGGAALGIDCFGGDGRAAEIALDELLGLVFDALPDDAMPTEEP